MLQECLSHMDAANQDKSIYTNSDFSSASPGQNRDLDPIQRHFSIDSVPLSLSPRIGNPRADLPLTRTTSITPNPISSSALFPALSEASFPALPSARRRGYGKVFMGTLIDCSKGRSENGDEDEGNNFWWSPDPGGTTQFPRRSPDSVVARSAMEASASNVPLTSDEETFKVVAVSENASEMLSHAVPNIGNHQTLGIGTDVKSLLTFPSTDVADDFTPEPIVSCLEKAVGDRKVLGIVKSALKTPIKVISGGEGKVLDKLTKKRMKRKLLRKSSKKKLLNENEPKPDPYWLRTFFSFAPEEADWVPRYGHCGILSPLLANICLNELDNWMEDRIVKYFCPSKLNSIWKESINDGCHNPAWPEFVTSSGREKTRRMDHVRYGSHILVGIRGPREDTIELRKDLIEFCEARYGLRLENSKVEIEHITRGIQFLDYVINRRVIYPTLHYTATDIPHALRFLFMENKVRMICDCTMQPVKVIQDHRMDKPINLSGSTLRAPHGCHAQFMTNMGSIASLVLSITINDDDEDERKLDGDQQPKGKKPFYAILHRINEGLVVDLEPINPADVPVTASGALKSYKLAAKAISRLQYLPSGNISLMCDVLVREVSELTGYDKDDGLHLFQKIYPWLFCIELAQEMMHDKKSSMSAIAGKMNREFDDLSCIFIDDNAVKLIFRIHIIKDEAMKDELQDDTVKDDASLKKNENKFFDPGGLLSSSQQCSSTESRSFDARGV